MSVRSVILERVIMIAGPQDKPLGPLAGDLPLSGKSLDPLYIVARLDDEPGLVAPSTDGRLAGPVTPGDFTRFHNEAAA
jgi:hypothetical protein